MNSLEEKATKALYDRVHGAIYRAQHREQIAEYEQNRKPKTAEQKQKKAEYDETRYATRKQEYKIHAREWYVKHKDEQNARCNEWDRAHPEERRAWRLLNIELVRAAARKGQSKRRGLGHLYLNAPFVGSDGHHVDNEQVINIPRALHRSIRHNQHTGQGMAKINVLAYEWLAKEISEIK